MKRRFLAAIFVPVLLFAQGPPPGQGRQGPAWWEMPWWNSPLVRDLNLSPTQMREIRETVRDYRGSLMELRETVQRADADLEAILNSAPVDQQKANEAIDKLAAARAEMTRRLSRMTLRLRGILTNEQWQELHQRASERGRFGRGRGGPGGGPGGPPGGPPSGETFKQ